MNITAAATDLFIYGREAAFGALFQSAFTFDNSIRDYNERLLDSSPAVGGMGRDRALLIGIHARHPSEMPEIGFVKYNEEKDCIRHVISASRSLFGERFCVLVVSTDKNHSLFDLSTFANSIGCEVLKGKEIRQHTSPSISSLADEKFSMLSDLALLSSVDIFIGSTQSSGSVRSYFSALVANNLALRQRGSKNVRWLPDASCTEKRDHLNSTTDIPPHYSLRN
jgi:hypothetical protein